MRDVTYDDPTNFGSLLPSITHTLHTVEMLRGVLALERCSAFLASADAISTGGTLQFAGHASLSGLVM